MSELSEEEFATQWIKDVIGKNSVSALSLDLSSSYFNLVGNEKFYRHYLCIQKHLSEIIPREYNRPTIEFHVKGTDWIDGGPACNIIGGMGPVSDSQLLDKILQQLSNDKYSLNRNFRIKLLSIPPPREARELFWGGFRYFRRLRAFLGSRSQAVYLASNTAHIYLPMFRALSTSPVIDMTEHVVNILHSQQANTRFQRILILGTIAGHQNQLYESKLTQKNIPFVILPYEEQSFVQEVINATKENRLQADQLLTFLKKLQIFIEKEKFDAILLACTELPIALHDQIHNHTLTISPNQTILVIDSEQIFAEIISQHLKHGNPKFD
mmetsp:Transcript_1215/g.1999  ORF Transcript_1215/g.1999 Transcript_1215/m.1999 type:complete len:325 (-) Transcript_1215:2916-3890(-)